MGSRDHFRLGDYNAYCDVCGFKYKASELRKRWDGAMVCKRDWEPRHPQDFVKGIKEDQTLPFYRTGGTDTYQSGYVQALAGATTITGSSLGTDNRVVVDVIPQTLGTEGAVTITVAASVVSGDVVIIKGAITSGVAVTVVNNSTGTVTQLD